MSRNYLAALQHLASDLDQMGVEVIAVSGDPRERAEAFVRVCGVRCPLIWSMFKTTPHTSSRHNVATGSQQVRQRKSLQCMRNDVHFSHSFPIWASF